MDAPTQIIAPTHIHTYMRYCATESFYQNAASNIASAVWPTANKAFFYPIWLPFPFQLKRFFLQNGSSATGNFDIGIYSADGTKLQSTGSTAQSGTSVLQYAGSFDVMLLPGAYYFAMAANSASLTVARVSAWSVNVMRSCGCLEQTTAFALPATMASAVGISVAYIPHFGITQTASGF